MTATVDPLLALSLFEAVRAVDMPSGEYDAEYVHELRNKRFGLSDTVSSQIRRFHDAVRRKQQTPFDEAVALATLVGRRPDAERVFRKGGRVLAQRGYETISPLTRRLMQSLPALLSRPIALRRARRLTRRFAGGNLRRVGSTILLEVPRSVTLLAAPGLVGCAFYESMLHELLQLLGGNVGPVAHVRCAGRGEGVCQWRAEWRTAGTRSR